MLTGFLGRIAGEARRHRRESVCVLWVSYVADLFCSRPFEHFEVQHNGLAYLCCPGWLPESIGKVDEQAPTSLWNSEKAIRIRRSILDGSFRYCTSCPLLGVRRDPVKPVSELTDPEHLRIVRQRQVVMNRIKTVYLAYDRTCNLSCPSCRHDVNVAKGPELRRLTVYQDSLVSPALLRSIECLNITGSGDPFASALFRGLLRSLDATKYPRLRIELHTNGLLFSPENWDAMKAAQPMVKSVEVSVDAATEGTYAQNRRGGDWYLLLERLKFIQSLRLNGPIERFQMSFVVQSNNWREMPAFVRLAREHGADTVLFTALRDWGTFGTYEFARRAVHQKYHPEHRAFLASLDAQPEFRDQRVVLSDFTAENNPHREPTWQTDAVKRSSR